MSPTRSGRSCLTDTRVDDSVTLKKRPTGWRDSEAGHADGVGIVLSTMPAQPTLTGVDIDHGRNPQSGRRTIWVVTPGTGTPSESSARLVLRYRCDSEAGGQQGDGRQRWRRGCRWNTHTARNPRVSNRHAPSGSVEPTGSVTHKAARQRAATISGDFALLHEEASRDDHIGGARSEVRHDG